MILVCQSCASDMTETAEDHYRCPVCGFEAEQLSLFPSEIEFTSSSRLEILQTIDKIMRSKCKPCATRIEMNKMNGNATSRLEKICNHQCPVGKQIQSLGKRLDVGPRKEVDLVGFYGIEKNEPINEMGRG